MNTIIKVKQIVSLIYVFILVTCPILAQDFTSCESGEVGVFVSLQYTDVNIPAGEVSWDIQDSDGNILEDFNYLPIASNFIFTSDEICLPEGEIYTFNTYDSGGDGWGFGSWYELSICGGNDPIINNSGNAPSNWNWNKLLELNDSENERVKELYVENLGEIAKNKLNLEEAY